MKKLLLLVTLVTVAALYSCSKESISATDVLTDNSTATLTDRGGKGGQHGPRWHHYLDSTHVDSIKHHYHDSLHVHNDSLHIHHDSLHVHNDSLHNGGHHGNGGNHGNGGMGCHVPPSVITVADLPQAAQDWLTANLAGATIESVVRITKIDCKVTYTVKLADGTKVRFDADGKKLN